MPKAPGRGRRWVDAVELVSHRHADGLKSFEAGPALGDMPTEQLGVPVLGDAEQRDFAVLDGGDFQRNRGQLSGTCGSAVRPPPEIPGRELTNPRSRTLFRPKGQIRIGDSAADFGLERRSRGEFQDELLIKALVCRDKKIDTEITPWGVAIHEVSGTQCVGSVVYAEYPPTQPELILQVF